MKQAMGKMQQDAVLEIFNVGMHNASEALNAMFKHVNLHTLTIDFIDEKPNVKHIATTKYPVSSMITMGFEGDISGGISLLMPPQSAAKLVNALTNESLEVDHIDILRMGTLTEVGNILMNNIIAAFCDVVKRSLTFSLPIYLEGTGDELVQAMECRCETAWVNHMSFEVESLKVEGVVLVYFNHELSSSFLSTLGEGCLV